MHIIKIKYRVPVIEFISGEKEIEINKESLSDLSFEERVKILYDIVDGEGCITSSLESAYEMDYAWLKEPK